MSYAMQKRLLLGSITTDYYTVESGSTLSGSNGVTIEIPSGRNVLAITSIGFLNGSSGTGATNMNAYYYYFDDTYIYVNVKNSGSSTATITVNVKYLYTTS